MAEYIVRVDEKRKPTGHPSDPLPWLLGLPALEEVIRCRDCAWFQKNASPHDPDGRYNFCAQFGFDFQGSSGFCAWAEKRTGDGND